MNLRIKIILLSVAIFAGLSYKILPSDAREKSVSGNFKQFYFSEQATEKLSKQEPKGQKLALLIGINKYKNGISSLNGCVNDVTLMRNLLIKNYGFQESNITTLVDRNATKKHILDAFKNQLINKVRVNDVVVVHFSGHGHQMKDSAPMDEDDDLDEVLVAHDFELIDEDNARNGIVDDEINGLLNALGKKTANITFIFDACHSGGGTKDVFTTRNLGDSDRRRKMSDVDDMAIGDGSRDLKGRDSKFVLLSGCRADEKSYEFPMNGKNTNGLLTYYLVKQLEAAALTNKLQNLTYGDVMENVRYMVAIKKSNQHPQVEGTNINNLIFGVATDQVEGYLNASPIDPIHVKLHGGLILGVTEGSIYDIYKPGTKKFSLPDRPICQIKITKVEEGFSTGKIVSGNAITVNSRAVELKHNFGNRKLNVFFDGDWTGRMAQATKQEIIKRGFIADTPKHSSHIVLAILNDKISLSLSDDPLNPITSFSTQDSDFKLKLNRKIDDWSKWFRVLDIENKRPQLNIKVDLVRSTAQGSKDPLASIGKADYTFKHDDRIKIKISNNSERDLFFHILNLKDDGSIAAYHLGAFKKPSSNANEKIVAGRSWEGFIRAKVSDGKLSSRDIFKVFATTDSEVRFDYLTISDSDTEKVVYKKQESLFARDLTPEGTTTDLDDWITMQRVLVVRR